MLDKDIEAVIHRCHSQGQFNGVAAASVNGQPILMTAMGHAHHGTGQDLTVDTRFVVGSLTKGITAAAVLQLQQQGKLLLEDSIGKYLECPGGNMVTIHHLLNHTAGLPFNPHSQEAPPQIGHFRYSNLGYIILGQIIEAVSGQALDCYLQENIFGPLNMGQTGFPCPERRGLPTGYNKAAERAYLSKLEIAYPIRGCGGLCSTAGDLMKWDLSLKGNTLLSKESTELMFTPGQKGYGYGWYIGTRPVRQWHTGTGAGFRTMLYREQQDGNSFSLVLLSNYQNSPVETITNSIRRVLTAPANWLS